MKFFSFVFFLFLIQNTFSQSKLIDQNQLKIIEQEFQKELNSQKHSAEVKLKLYLKIANEAYAFRLYEQAYKYYGEAIALNTKENKSDAYINKIAISINNQDRDKVKQDLANAKKYFDQNEKYFSEEVKYYLATTDKAFSESQKNDKKISGFYGLFAKDQNIKTLIVSKKYDQAFSMYDPKIINKSESQLDITTFDTLNVILHKKNVKELYCTKELAKYPNAFAYSTLVCTLLSEYLTNGAMTEKNIKRADSFFSKVDSSKRYLFDVVQEIR